MIGKIIKDKGLGFELAPLENVIEPLRMVKTDEEIALIQAAADISDRAMAHIRQVARSGMTELEAAWEIEKFMREAGSQAIPFEGIVGGGPNAALPHHKPSGRPLQNGESIVIDIGAKVGYYASDLTRTVCLGKPDDRIRKVYEIVLEAQRTALDGIRAGMTGEQADALARDVIVKAGFGENFGHGLGHGTGLAVHEWPRVSLRGTDVLADGMVFSVEPGIYLVGYGGVRIEDLVVMRNGRVTPLSKAPKVFEI
jgi:Xaa-Pro aminopeptidase